MIERVACNLCGADDATVILKGTLTEGGRALSSEELACSNPFHGGRWPVVRCNRCGLVYMNPRDDRESLERGYAEVVDKTYVEEKDARVLTFERAVREIHSFRGPGRLLDIGCGIGVFLDIARRHGWEVQGQEPGTFASRYAREVYGLDVRDEAVRPGLFADGRFDVITLWDVIEHLADPGSMLAVIRRWLKPGGLLFLSTMNIECRFVRVAGPLWPWWMRMHLYYFTPRTISQLLFSRGYRVVKVLPYKHIVRVSYLLKKLAAYSSPLAGILRALARFLRQESRPVSVDMGDFMMVVAENSPGPRR